MTPQIRLVSTDRYETIYEVILIEDGQQPPETPARPPVHVRLAITATSIDASLHGLEDVSGVRLDRQDGNMRAMIYQPPDELPFHQINLSIDKIIQAGNPNG